MWVLLRLAAWYNWLHWTVALLGNVLFLAGSILFLDRSTQTLGTWCFIAGASGMLIGRIGSTIMEMEYKHLRAEWNRMRNRMRGSDTASHDK